MIFYDSTRARFFKITVEKTKYTHQSLWLKLSHFRPQPFTTSGSAFKKLAITDLAASPEWQVPEKGTGRWAQRKLIIALPLSDETKRKT